MIAGGILSLAVLLPGSAIAGGAHLPRHVALVVSDTATVRSAPSAHAPVIATLAQQSEITVLRTRGAWENVRLWASVNGWMRARDIGFRRHWSTTSTYRAPVIHASIHRFGPVGLVAHGSIAVATTARRTPAGSAVRDLPGGAGVAITGWMQDIRGAVWYRTSSGWIAGADIILPRPAAASRGAAPLPTGTGMWLTLGTVNGTSTRAIMDAVRRDHITHLYLEAAISPLGFHGRGSVGPLLDAAHRQHVMVIAWVYPYLTDIAGDVALTRSVAAFRTASGSAFDGIAADLERNMSTGPIRVYSDLVRAYLGPSYLLVGVTYPPQSLASYPFAEVARDYNVLAPMDYWHQTPTKQGLDYNHMRYGEQYAYRYALASVAAIKQAAPQAIVEPIGQVFDDFGRLELGPHAPSSEEIKGFLEGSRAAGARGVSFFQWMTATAAEWQEIREYGF